jgi:replication factor C subunit 1
VGKLKAWINNWENVHNSGRKAGQFEKKAALLSGPPGIGKTTAATLVAEACGR